MKWFGQVVRTIVNVALVPVAFARDVHALAVGEPPTFVADAVQRLKDEASE